MESAGSQGPTLDSLASAVADLAQAQTSLSEKLLSLSEKVLAQSEDYFTLKAEIEALSTRLTTEMASAYNDIKRLENWVETIRPGSKLRHCRRCGRLLADYEKGEWHTACKPGGPGA